MYTDLRDDPDKFFEAHKMLADRMLGAFGVRSIVARHTSHVTRRTSHVTRLTSHVTCHMSHVTRHMSVQTDFLFASHLFCLQAANADLDSDAVDQVITAMRRYW